MLNCSSKADEWIICDRKCMSVRWAAQPQLKAAFASNPHEERLIESRRDSLTPGFYFSLSISFSQYQRLEWVLQMKAVSLSWPGCPNLQSNPSDTPVPSLFTPLMLLQTYCLYFLQKQKGYFQQISMQLFSKKLQFNSNHDCQTRGGKKAKNNM